MIFKSCDTKEEVKKEEGMFVVVNKKEKEIKTEVIYGYGYSGRYEIPKIYLTLEEAKKEAEKLAKGNPDTEYCVLGIVGTVFSKYNPPDVPKWSIG